jgi:type II secretory pathway component GspD/PulD (secretin)
VGGLSRERMADDYDGIPFLERLPLLNRLSSLETKTSERSHLFVFIKPIILRDDKFEDLRFLSEIDQRKACLPGEFPQSRPMLVR